ncbi:hypothetical protein PIB30_043375 [Stylosanthes scabra]|uniref:Uncharacterized protein n=1 Tax=Stylosanthes scabra TaxID=79078 RepID=A0ABU6YE65_9FABA|nr:hypothetical protein [Stylosanthes scabra]
MTTPFTLLQEKNSKAHPPKVVKSAFLDIRTHAPASLHMAAVPVSASCSGFGEDGGSDVQERRAANTALFNVLKILVIWVQIFH